MFRYAGLFFTFGVDIDDNELGHLEAIHLFVEILDQVSSECLPLLGLPHRIAPHHTAPHRTAPRRTAPRHKPLGDVLDGNTCTSAQEMLRGV